MIAYHVTQVQGTYLDQNVSVQMDFMTQETSYALHVINPV